jgi:putative membrane-bound dehydrogenase-like protein
MRAYIRRGILVMAVNALLRAVLLRHALAVRLVGVSSVAIALALLGVGLSAARPGQELSNGKPLSPREECATFRLQKGFHAELVACEPDVVDPVAMAFDEDGRLYVAEMRGYPNAGVATGNISSGRIVRLEDRDGDGYFETATVFADGLRFPTGLMPWRGGLLVANAPDLLYLEDTTGSGKADRRRTLYTGFSLVNIQQLLNSLQWGLDNYVYACAGFDGGTIRSAEKPDAPSVTLRGRGIRFRPSLPGSLEPTSGGGQYGLAPDDFGRWFTATNNQHLRHIVLPDHYLRRNPSLQVGAVTIDIPDHEAACKVFRISPFEAWRVERTARRANFPTPERVPGGYVTSGCSPVVYAADAFPAAYQGNTFVCDPANNLIHRDVLVPNGATFTARRGDEGCEFLASTDNWFRPVALTLGPDGAIYVLDFYREVIETPLSLPDDIKKRLFLESSGRGRIWRIASDTPRPEKAKKSLRLSKATTNELVARLADPNSWWRLTAQRLLVERQDRAAIASLKELARASKSAPGRAHALRTLEGLNALDDELVGQALKDADAGVREQALQMADSRLTRSAAIRQVVAALADDPSARVRFQLALSLGEASAPESLAALTKVARRDAGDPWIGLAVLSSSRHSAAALLEALTSDKQYTTSASAESLQMLGRLARLAGAEATDADLARMLNLLPASGQRADPWQFVLLEGLGEGLRGGARTAAQLWEQPPAPLKDAVARARPLFGQAAAVAEDEKRPVGERRTAARLLASGPYATALAAAPALLTPQTPPDLQLEAVRMLASHSRPEVADVLLAHWNSYGPAVRREVTESLFARADRLPRLLEALSSKQVLANQFEPRRLEQLRKHADLKIREVALALLAENVSADRQAIVAAYRTALAMEANVDHGRQAFRKNCATCHRLENEGHDVGPDLRSAVRDKPGEYLLVAILDPSREVDPRYLNYVVTTKKGQTITGLIAAETSSSLTLRRGEGAEDTILRSQIDSIEATAKSVMPEGLELQLSRQDVADLIAYLQLVTK